MGCGSSSDAGESSKLGEIPLGAFNYNKEADRPVKEFDFYSTRL